MRLGRNRNRKGQLQFFGLFSVVLNTKYEINKTGFIPILRCGLFISRCNHHPMLKVHEEIRIHHQHDHVTADVVSTLAKSSTS